MTKINGKKPLTSRTLDGKDYRKLKEILTRRLKLKDPQFRLEGRGRISGSLVSATFTGKPDHMRQQMIWDALEERRNRRHIGSEK